VGAGGSISFLSDAINKYINKNNCVSIGINNMASVVTPNYHLWTNKKRYKEYGSCVDTKSALLVGPKFSRKLVRLHYSGRYLTIQYKDGPKYETKLMKNGMIYGHFRTAGSLSIMLAHNMGASRISIVGMDGYTLHRKKDVVGNQKNQHCYGSGFTDGATWSECIEKDNIVYNVLKEIKSAGVEFSILTPTVFDEFYDNSLLV